MVANKLRMGFPGRNTGPVLRASKRGSTYVERGKDPATDRG